MSARKIVVYSALLTNLIFSPSVYAGPTGGHITGGTGSINQVDFTTNIQQNTSKLSIDWNSFDVQSNEIVNFIQPGTSSIALNRILSHSASEIFGQINANGQVVLVNPNGVFFGESASINVGGLIASGLDISTSDFLNGEYFFNEVIGSEGSVINSGLINASLGGNIALIGKQVINNGVISAQLGSVSLAAGKAAVLTFDAQGLIGVRVSEAILQDELGVDPAIINRGEITAAGGRVLLSASTSQDVFSQAVNSGEIQQATSVVVHEDGSFTLGGGADVVNTGSLNVSTTDAGQDGGQIVVLGENVTSSGSINADAENASGGDIELHALDTTSLSESSVTTVRSENSGVGGVVKILGDKVGLFDQSVIDASGSNGGGEVLAGGDQKGENKFIRNAEFLFMGEETQIQADALDKGNGGEIIAFSNNTSRIYGSLKASGGINGGNGGFIETSGKQGLEVTRAADASASNGTGGSWLIDPRNVDIVNSYTGGCTADRCPDPLSSVFSASVDNTEILASVLKQALVNNGTGVSIDTGSTGSQDGNISINESLDYNNAGQNTLTLNAENNITFAADKSIFDSDPSTKDSLNLNLYASGAIILNSGVIIDTQGGNFTVGDTVNSIIPTSFTSTGATIDTSGASSSSKSTPAVDAGNITINVSGAVSTGALTAKGGTIAASDGSGSPNAGGNGGDVSIHAASVSILAAIDTYGSAGRYDNNDSNNHTGGNGGAGGLVNITSVSGGITVEAINTSGGAAAGTYDTTSQTDRGPYYGNGGNAGAITLATTNATSSITLNGDFTSVGTPGYIEAGNAASTHGSGADIVLNGDVVLASNITIQSVGATDGTVDEPGTDGTIGFNGTLEGTTSRMQDLALSGGAINFGIDGGGDSVGGTARLKDLLINASGAVNAWGNMYLGSLNIASSTAFNNHTNLIDTIGLSDTVLGSVSITSSGDISVSAITAQGAVADADANGNPGGVINLTSNAGGIMLNGTVSSIGGDGSTTTDTNGGDASAISISATGGVVAINADIASQGGAGSGAGTAGTNSAISINAQAISSSTENIISGGSVTLDSVDSIALTNSLMLSAANSAVNGNNDVLVNANVDYNGIFTNGTDRVLTINAADDIALDSVSDSTVGGSDQLAITLLVNSDSGRVEIADTISTGGSNFSANAFIFSDWTGTNNAGIYGDILTAGGAVSIDSVDHLGLFKNITTSDGQLDITVTAGIFYNDTANGAISSGSGNINITANGVTDTGCIGCGAWIGDISTTSGNLTIDSSAGNGHIHQDNQAYAVTVGGTTTLNAGAGNIELDNALASVDFGGAVALTAATASIIDTNSIQLNTSTLSGDLTITAIDGGISQFAGSALIVNGASSFTSTDGSIIVDNAGNDFTGIVNVDNTGGNAITIGDDNSFTLGSSDLSGGTYTVNAGTNISLPTGVNPNGSASTLILNANSDINLSADPYTGTGLLALNFAAAGLINVNTPNISSGGAAITFDGATVLLQSSTIVAGTGKVDFRGILDATMARVDSLQITAGDIDFVENIGATTRLGDLTANASGIVTASAITANSLTVASSDKFTSGSVDTSGIADSVGGNVSILATTELTTGGITASAGDATGTSNGAVGGIVDLTAASINASGIVSLGGNASGISQTGGAGGAITLTAIANGGVKAITLNSNLDNTGGLSTDGTGNISSPAISLLLVDSAGITDGLVSINHTDDFSSAITVIGSDDTDTLVAADNANNYWKLVADGSGFVSTIEGGENIQFSGIEILTGGAGDDKFSFSSSAAFTQINGADQLTGGDIVDQSMLATVNIRLGDYSGIEKVIGNNADSTLTGQNQLNTWTIDGVNSGEVSNPDGLMAFSGFTHLVGNSATDHFILNNNGVDTSGDLAGSITGGSGADDSLSISYNSGVTWHITADNEGDVTLLNTGVLDAFGFSGIENLNGGDQDDSFKFDAGMDISGSIDAAGGTDSIDLSSQAVVMFNLASGLNGRTGFEQVVGNFTTLGNSTLQGTNTDTTWTIDGANSGSIGSLNFSQFNNLTGGSGQDTFNFSTDSAMIDGLIDGGGSSAGPDTVNLNSSLTAYTVQLGGSAGAVSDMNGYLDLLSISQINANTLLINTLRGPQTGTNSWVIDSELSGKVNNGYAFSGFSHLTGGDDGDDFSFTQTNLASQIVVDGGPGSNSISGSNIDLSWNVSGTDSGELYDTDVDTDALTNMDVIFSKVQNLFGNNSNDLFIFNEPSSVVLVDGGNGAGVDEVRNLSSSTSWTIDGSNQGDIAGLLGSFIGIENLSGSETLGDTFQFADGGAISGIVTGGANGVDSIVNLSSSETEWTLTNPGEGSIAAIVSFTGIENLTGSDVAVDHFTLQPGASLSGQLAGGSGAGDEIINQTAEVTHWVIDGSDMGQVTGVISGFSGVENLTGGTNNDDFVFSDAGSINSINGNGGTNSITGKNLDNDWLLSAAAAGSVENSGIAYVGSFVDIQTIKGGSGSDTLSGYDNDNTWNVSAPGAGTVLDTSDSNSIINFSGIENLVGDDAGDDLFFITGSGELAGTIDGGTGVGSDSLTLSINNVDVNSWFITGADSGGLAGYLNTAGAVGDDGFSGIESIKGSDDADSFSIQNTSFIDTINGGNDDNGLDPNDTVDFSGLAAAFTVNLGSTTGFVNIDSLIGNNTNPMLGTLVGENTTNSWDITGTNSGSINGLDFTDFANLTGGNVQDTFTFYADGIASTKGDISGLIDGVANVDTGSGIQADSVNFYLPADLTNGAAASAIQVQLEGVAGAPANASGYFDVVNIAQINANPDAPNTLKAGDNSNTWGVTASHGGNVNTTGFTGFSVLTGGTGDDSFQLHDSIDFTGSINGGGGSGDSLVAGERDTGWIINAADSGTVTGLSGTFSQVESLEGNAGNFIDTFQLHDSIDFAGSIDGGGGSGDSLVAGARNAGWVVTAADSGTVSGLTGSFSQMEVLQGNAGDFIDTFQLHDSIDFAGSIDGGGGSGDSIVAGARDSNWAISALNNTGTVTGLTGTFSHVNILQGNAGDFVDTFQLHATEDFTGSIDGGGGSGDSLVAGARNSAWAVNAADSGTVTGITGTFSHVDILQGNSGDFIDSFQLHDSIDFAGSIDGGGGSGDSIVAGARDTDWIINAADSGTVTGLTGAFSQMEILQGNAGDFVDTFQLHDGIDFAGSIDGGGGSGDRVVAGARNTDWAITAANNTGTVTGLTGTFSHVDILQGNAGDFVDTFQLHDTENFDGSIDGAGGSDDFVVAGARDSNWVITAANNTGTVTGLTGTFSHVNILQGNAGDFIDTFQLHATEDFDGSIDGVGGNGDRIVAGARNTDWAITDANNTGTVTGLTGTFSHVDILQGNAGDFIDTFQLHASENFDGSIDGGGGSGDSVVAGGRDTNWAITAGNNTGTVTGVTGTFSHVDRLQGNAGDFIDSFQLHASENFNGSIDGGSGNADSVVAGARDTDWAITAANNTGTVSGVTGTFSWIENLQGNAGDFIDTFHLHATENFTGSIDGGGGSGDRVIAGARDTDWAITAANNTGTVTGLTGTFIHVESLEGNTGYFVDTFQLHASENFSGSIDGGGGAGDRLLAGARDTDWEVTAVDEGNVTGIDNASPDFTAIEFLVGNNQDDSFSLNGGTLSGTIVGGDGNDTLTGGNVDNNWQITAANEGNVTGVDTANTNAIYDFSGIENLTGNQQNDIFIFDDGTTVSGVINGGNLAMTMTDADVVDLSAFSTEITVILGAEFLNIEKLIANNNATLVGQNLNNDWRIFNLADPTISAPATIVDNQGTVTDSNNLVVSFEGFNNITGGDLADNFLIESNGNITGTIDGGASDDTIDLSSQAVVDRTVDNALSGFSNIAHIEGINGNGTASILRASDLGSNWIISGNNSGTVTSGTSSTSFTNFNILQGGNGTDVFNITATGSIGDQSAADTVSRLNGGAGDDQFSITLSGSQHVNINLLDGDGAVTVVGNAINFSSADLTGTDRIDINGASANFDTDSYSVDYARQLATHTYSNAAATASVSYFHVATINDAVQSAELMINGDGAANTVTLTGTDIAGEGNFVVGNGVISFVPVDFQDKTSLAVRNLGTAGHIVLSGNTNLRTGGGYFAFSADQIDRTGSMTLTGDELRLQSVSVDVDSANPLLTTINQLQVINTTADLYIQDSNGLTLAQIDTTGLLDIVAITGNITDSDTQGLMSGGDLRLTASNGDILLDNADNALTGLVSFDTGIAGTASLNNSGSFTTTRLGESHVGSLTVTSTHSDIQGLQPLTATIATFDAGSYDIRLTNVNNDLDTLSVIRAASIDFTDLDNLRLGDINLDSGILRINALGILQQADTAITQTADIFGFAGDISINSGAGVIGLANAGNDFSGAVSLNNTGNFDVEVTDLNAIQLAASNLGSGAFTVNAGSGITQTAALSQAAGAGRAGFNAGAGVITLNQANDFGGEVALHNTGNFNVVVTGRNDIRLASSSVGSGSFTITASGDITQTGALTQQAAAAATHFITGAGAITLDHTGNDFTGVVSLSNNGNNDVTVTDQNAIQLGASSVGTGLLTVNATGISQTAGIIQAATAGMASFYGNAGAIDLTQSNDFTGAVALHNTGAFDVALTDINNVQLAASTVGSGAFSVNAASGISQSGAITQAAGAGITGFNAGAGGIDLTQSNDFTGTVALHNSGTFDVEVTDLNNIQIGTSTLGSGALTINAGGNITQAAAITQQAGAGSAHFTTGTAVITLDNAGNDFTGAVSLTNSGNNDVSVSDQNAILLGASSVGSGLFTVNATGISQSAGIFQADAAGLARFNGHAGGIDLTRSNDFTGALSLNNTGVFDVAVSDLNHLQIAASTLGSGALTINAAGNITQTGPITQQAGAKTAHFTSGAGVITLDNAGNDFTGAVSLTNSGNNDVSVTDQNAIQLGASSVGSGLLTVNALTGITQSGAISQLTGAGTADFYAGEGMIKLDNINNHLAGTVSLNNSGSHEVTVSNSTGIDLGASNVGGGFDIVALNGGDITQSAMLTVGGDSSFTVDAGQIIQLDNEANHFDQAVSFFANGGGQLLDVLIANDDRLDLGNINVSRYLGVVANGDVTNSGILQVDGVTWIQSSGNSISLNNPLNDFNDIAFGDASSVSIFDVNSVNIGAADSSLYSVSTHSAITGNLSVTSLSGDITDNDSSALSVAGVSTLNAGSGIGNVVLDATTNDFSQVNIIAAHHVTLADVNSIDLQSTAINGNLAVLAGTVITNIAGPLKVTGTADFIAGNNQTITLNNAANQLTGALTFGSSSGNLSNVSLQNSVATDIQSVAVNNDLSVMSGGAITQGGSFYVGNAAVFSAINDSLIEQDITLENINDLNELSIPHANNVRLNNGMNGLTINELVSSGNITITSGDLLSVNDISGASVMLSSASGSVSLNSISSLGIVAVTSRNLTVNGDITATDVSLDSGVSNTLLNSISASGSVVSQSAGFTSNGSVSGSEILINSGSGVVNIGADLNATAAVDISSTGINTDAGAELSAASIVINAGSGTANFMGKINSSGPLAITSTGLTLSETINSTDNMLLDATSGNAILNNQVSVNAGDLSVKGSNIVQNSTIKSLAGNVNLVATGSYTMNTDAAIDVNGNLTLDASGDASLQAIDTQSDINLASQTGSITFNEAINTSQGNLRATTNQNITVNGNQTIQQNITLTSIQGGITQNAALNSEQGDITLSSGNRIDMGFDDSTTSQTGNIQYSAVNDVASSMLTAENGTVGIRSSGGSINDINGDNTNFIASLLELRASNGIGDGASLEAQVAEIDIENSDSGTIKIDNTGDLVITSLKNTGSSGGITIFNDQDFHITPGSIDAGYDTGALFMRTTSGDFLGEGPVPDFSNADITARTATFFGLSGTFGTTRRPIVLNIRDSALIQTRASLNPRFSDPRPQVQDESLLKFTDLDTLSAIAGEQLVEIESLGEVDPAIFTELQNFSMLEISIQMPQDQLFEDELAEYKKKSR